MNKTLIIYNSKYGYTKKYAQWLSEALNADICESKNLKSKNLNCQNLTFPHKMMMKIAHTMLSKKPENELTDADKDFLSLNGKKIDFTDKKMLEPVILYKKKKKNSE
jgi:flavodoxin